MMLQRSIAECDGCFLHLESLEVPTGWSQLHDYDGTKIFCSHICLHVSNAGAVPVSRGASLDLSVRDVELIELITTGLSDSQMAFRVGCAPSSLKNRLGHIYRKLGVHSRLSCALVAMSLGIVASPGLNAVQAT